MKCTVSTFSETRTSGVNCVLLMFNHIRFRFSFSLRKIRTEHVVFSNYVPGYIDVCSQVTLMLLSEEK
jgi:hypothetical protein